MRTLTSILALLALCLFPSGAFAQDSADLQKKYDDKVAETWVSHGGWVLDLDEALAIAKKENKLVFAYFSRSYSP